MVITVLSPPGGMLPEGDTTQHGWCHLLNLRLSGCAYSGDMPAFSEIDSTESDHHALYQPVTTRPQGAGFGTPSSSFFNHGVRAAQSYTFARPNTPKIYKNPPDERGYQAGLKGFF